MRVLVTGANGQLGRAFQWVLPKEDSFFFGHKEMDITNAPQVLEVIEEKKPDIVIHCAAYTNVDGCEQDPNLAYDVNAGGTENIVRAIEESDLKAVMVYISTDYVFGGDSPRQYTEDDNPNPLNVYGRSKLEGEKFALEVSKHYIIRTSWVFGDGKNFVRTMLKSAGNTNSPIPVVFDQVGRPTYTLDLAQTIWQLILRETPYGIYNITGSGSPISWFAFAREIFEQSKKSVEVSPITSKEFENLPFNQGKKIAERPSYSILNLSKIEGLGIETRPWPEALGDYLKTLGKVGERT